MRSFSIANCTANRDRRRRSGSLSLRVRTVGRSAIRPSSHEVAPAEWAVNAHGAPPILDEPIARHAETATEVRAVTTDPRADRGDRRNESSESAIRCRRSFNYSENTRVHFRVSSALYQERARQIAIAASIRANASIYLKK
jgi:hypothetical protein